MKREMEFRKVQTEELLIGTQVEIYESELRTLSGVMYYYTIEPAIAMSNNTPKRLKSRTGKVTAIKEDGSEWIVTVEFEELD